MYYDKFLKNEETMIKSKISINNTFYKSFKKLFFNNNLKNFDHEIKRNKSILNDGIIEDTLKIEKRKNYEKSYQDKNINEVLDKIVKYKNINSKPMLKTL